MYFIVLPEQAAQIGEFEFSVIEVAVIGRVQNRPGGKKRSKSRRSDWHAGKWWTTTQG